MKQEFILYFDSIGITRTQKTRIEEIEDFYNVLCPDEIERVLITDFIDEEDRRQYESLWFISGRYVMEAKKFLTEDDFDITPYRRRIGYLDIKKKEYKINGASDNSRLSVRFSLTQRTSGELKASGKNCDVLWDFVKEYLVPNIVDNVSDAEIQVVESEV